MAGSVSEELARLAQLRDQGVLTEAEFEQQKAAALRGDQSPAAGVPVKKGRGKGCLLAVIAAIVILIVLGMIGSANKSNPAVAPPSGSASDAPTDAAATSTAPSLTMDGYNRVKTGMTFDQVTEIIGKPSQEMSRNELAGTETVMYSWEGNLGANMNAMFQNNKLVQKAQFGLR